MRNISSWARHHIWPARILLALSYLLLYGTGFAIGDMLSLSGLQFHSAFFYFPLAAFVTAGFFYPHKKDKGSYRNFYAAQKRTDLLLAGCTLLLCICYGNRPASLPSPSAAYASSVTATIVIEPQPKVKKGFAKRLIHKAKHTWHSFKNYYKSRITAGKVALIILAILVAAFLLMAVAALSCSLACSDMGLLAVLVLLLGTALIVYLLIKVVRKLNPKPRRERRRPEMGSASVA